MTIEKNINQLVEQFRAKVDQARMKENSSEEIQKAVEELLRAVSVNIPTTTTKGKKDPQKGMQTAMEYVQSYIGKNQNLPKGVQAMLDNIAAKKK
jgi:hypothetical protein